MKALFTSIFCLFSTFIYCQSDWDYFGSSSDSEKWYVKNITKPKNASSDEYDLWIKNTSEPKKYKNKKGIWITKGSTNTLQHLKIDCSINQFQILSWFKYNSKGDLVESSDLVIDQEVIPDTMSETIHNYICTKQ